MHLRKIGLPVLALACLLMQCSDPKYDQYFDRGEKLYDRHCSNCHHKNGEGLGLLYPPLNKSDFMESNFEQTLCIMKYGISGDLVVNGKSYNQPMPGVLSLTDLEIAEIATYLYNSGEHKRGLVPVTQVEKIMKDCAQ